MADTCQNRRDLMQSDHVKRTDKINGRNVRARRNHTAGGCVFTVVRSLHAIEVAMLLAWLAALLSLVAVAMFSVYLFIAHRRLSHLPSPKGGL